jgi:hypothetical protein
MIKNILNNKAALNRLSSALRYTDELFGKIFPIGTPVEGGRVTGLPRMRVSTLPPK